VTELAVTQYFTYWRCVELGSREILEGLVAREHAVPSPALAASLAEWGGFHYWQTSPEGRWLVLVRESTRARERWWVHAALLLLTLLTTTVGGVLLAHGADGIVFLPPLSQLRSGLGFSLPLLAILLAHESGHFFTARRYRVNASPPYFLPFPPQWNLLGTMGAFIRLRSPVFDRRTLFDIGVAGPLAGMIVALPVLLAGLVMSPSGAGVSGVPLAHQFVAFGGGAVLLGDSLLFSLCRALVGRHGMIVLSPTAVAGWVGLLVTSLNLLPLAQLDGGHIAFAMFGRAQLWIARVFWLLLVPLGYFWWRGWWIWAILGLIVGRGRLRHPPIIAPERPLDATRMVVGCIAIVLFIVTFMPLPIPS